VPSYTSFVPETSGKYGLGTRPSKEVKKFAGSNAPGDADADSEAEGDSAGVFGAEGTASEGDGDDAPFDDVLQAAPARTDILMMATSNLRIETDLPVWTMGNIEASVTVEA
jgi:hypothetical protein